MNFIGDFFHYGFWGMAIVELGQFGLVGNALFSVFALLLKGKHSRLRTLLLMTPLAATPSFILMLITLNSRERSHPIGGPVAIILFIWLCYFIFIPQGLFHLIRAKGFGAKPIFLWRLALTAIFCVALAVVHIIIGQGVLGITPD